LLSAWLGSQNDVRSWFAEVIQTRTLKSLAQPLTATGRVWFAAPNRFRWELGNPPQTIALRQAEQMLVVYPRLKHVERYPLTGDHIGPWREMLALLEAGFPRSQAELESRFDIKSAVTSQGAYEIILRPKSPSARHLMPRINITLSTNNFGLQATELHFADGTVVRNEFTNAVLNPKLDDSLFQPALDPTFRLIEPLKESSRNTRE